MWLVVSIQIVSIQNLVWEEKWVFDERSHFEVRLIYSWNQYCICRAKKTELLRFQKQIVWVNSPSLDAREHSLEIGSGFCFKGEF